MAEASEQVSGFFAPNCGSDKIGYILLDITVFIICFFGFCILCAIGWVAIRKIHANKEMILSLKYTIYAAILNTFIIISSVMIEIILCMGAIARADATPILFSITYGIIQLSVEGLLVCLLINLFLRLDVTFSESVLAISRAKRRMFVAFIVCEIFLIMVTTGLYASSILFNDTSDEMALVWFSFFMLFLFIYVVTSFVLVREFIQNLIAMAKFCVGSSQSVSNFELNDLQNDQVNLSAKYLALYFVATTSSFLCGGYITVTAITPRPDPYQPRYSLIVIDACVNISCLILSYAVMNPVYARYCRRIDEYCRRLATKQMKGRVRRVLKERALKQLTTEANVGKHEAIHSASSSSD